MRRGDEQVKSPDWSISRRDLLTGAAKSAAAAVGISTIGGLLASCGANAAPAGSASSVGKGPVKGTIQFSWWGTGERNTKTDEVIGLFQKKYPKATIQGEPVGDFTTYWQKLTVEAAAQNLPDVPQMQVRYMTAYDTRNALRPLDDLVTSGAIDVSGIPKVILDSGRGPDKKLYMIPTGSASDNWMYNETMVQTAGLASPQTLNTWEDIQKWLLEAKDKLPNGVYACDLQGGSDDSIWWAWVASHGYPVFTKTGTLGFPKKVMIDYWNWWESLRKAGATVPAAMQAEESTSNVQTYLAQGKVLMNEAPSNQLAAYQATLTAAGKGTMNVAAFPKTKQGNGSVLVNSGMSISANTSNLSAAAAWANFFANDSQGAKIYASDNGAVTVTKFLDEQIATASQLPTGTDTYLKFIRTLIANKPTVLIFPPNYSAVVLALTQNYSNVAFGRATVDAAVDAFFSAANSAASGG